MKKPLDIRDPTSIDPRDFPGLAALLLMGSPSALPWNLEYTSGSETEADLLRFDDEETLDRRPVARFADLSETMIERGTSTRVLQSQYQSDLLNTAVTLYYRDEKVRNREPEDTERVMCMKSGQYLDHRIGIGFDYLGPKLLEGLEIRYDFRVQHVLHLSEKDIQRWQEVADLRDASSKSDLTGPVREVFNMTDAADYLSNDTPNLTSLSPSSRTGAWTSLKAAISENQKYTGFEGLVLVLLPLIYGGIHLVAWNSDFATKLEEKLWKAACFDLMAQSILVWAGMASDSLSDTGLSFICNMLSLLNIPLYILARFYLVTESFVGLRHVPLGVYAVVPWAEYIPHI